MAEFEDKLSAILGNQEAMGQIMALAQSISGTGSQQQEEEEASGGDGWQETMPAAEGVSLPAGDLMKLLGDVDPRLIQTGMRLMGELNGGENQSAQVLHALKPYLKERRRARVDRAIQVARLARVVRLLFDTMGDKGGGTHV